MPFFFSVYWYTKVLNFGLVITVFILLYGSITYFYPLKIFLPYQSRSISTYINLLHGYCSTQDLYLRVNVGNCHKSKISITYWKDTIHHAYNWLNNKKYTWKLIHKTKVCFQISLHFHSLKSFRKITYLI